MTVSVTAAQRIVGFPWLGKGGMAGFWGVNQIVPEMQIIT
jgi:hypothetical protein